MPTFASDEAEVRFRSSYDAVLRRWPDDREEQRLTTGFGTTVVQTCGVASGLPVVLLCGGGATAASWHATAHALSGRCRVHAPDRPGEPGLSDTGPTQVRERDDWLSWLGSVLDRLGLERCALVGHSYGAWMALSYALRHPGRVSHLALLDPTSCFKGGRTGYNLRAIPLFVRPTLTGMRRFLAWETGGRSEDPRRLDPDYVDLLASAAADFPSARIVFPTRPAEQAMRELDVPTLLALPRESRQNDPRRTAASARSVLPRLNVVELDDQTHHTLPVGAPARLNEALVDFLVPGR